MLYCRLCNAEITFSDEYVSERTGKKIPLDLETEEPHDCPSTCGCSMFDGGQEGWDEE